MITDPDVYFTQGCDRCSWFATPGCATQIWADGLATLRGICLSAGLTETVKWGHPCYTHAGRNIAILGAFRNNFRISFMNPRLLKDPAGILQKLGPNTHTASIVPFTDTASVTALAPTLRAYLAEGAHSILDCITR